MGYLESITWIISLMMMMMGNMKYTMSIHCQYNIELYLKALI